MTAGWHTAHLGDVVRPATRAEAPVPGRTYRQIGVRLWGEGAYEREPVDGAGTRYAQLFRAEAGDLIVNKIWARNGSVGVVTEQLAGCFGSNEFPMFAPNRSRVEPAWLHWLTKTPNFWTQCDEKSRGTSGQNRIRPERFVEIEIPLPPLPEQRRIVARIEGLAAHVGEALAFRRQAVQEREALGRAGVDATYHELLIRHGSRNVGALCDSITDGDHNTPEFSDEGIPFIFVGNVSSGTLHFKNAKRVHPDYFRAIRAPRIPNCGDLLYTAVGATLGVPALVETDEPFCFQRHIAILKPRKDIVDSRFLWHMLRSRTVFALAWSSTTGSAQPTIPLRAIRQLLIPVPPLVEQEQIAETLDHIDGRLANVTTLQSAAAAELDALMPAILDRAFRGEL